MVAVIPRSLGIVVGVDLVVFRRLARAVLRIGRDGKGAERCGVFPRRVEIPHLDAEVQFNPVAFTIGGTGGLRIKHAGEVGHHNGVAVAGNFRRIPVVEIRGVEVDHLQRVQRIGGVRYFREAVGIGIRALGTAPGIAALVGHAAGRVKGDGAGGKHAAHFRLVHIAEFSRGVIPILALILGGIHGDDVFPHGVVAQPLHVVLVHLVVVDGDGVLAARLVVHGERGGRGVGTGGDVRRVFAALRLRAVPRFHQGGEGVGVGAGVIRRG